MQQWFFAQVAQRQSRGFVNLRLEVRFLSWAFETQMITDRERKMIADKICANLCFMSVLICGGGQVP